MVELDPAAPAQSVLYRYLAEGFDLPDPGRLAYLRRMLDAVHLACDEMVEAREADGPPPDLAALTRAVESAQAGSIEQLQADYTHLFLAGFPATPCRLVESVHVEGMLVGEATETAARSYLRFGLEARTREADSLVSELEFLAFLSGTPVEAGPEADGYRRARTAFLREHLLRWGPALVGKIGRAATNQLYLALADLFGWLLAADQSHAE